MNEDDRRLGASARSRQIHVEHLPLVGAIRDVVPDRQAMLRAGAKDLAEPVDHQLHVHRDILAQRGPTVAISAQRSAGIAGKLFPVSFIDYRDRTANNLSLAPPVEPPTPVEPRRTPQERRQERRRARRANRRRLWTAIGRLVDLFTSPNAEATSPRRIRCNLIGHRSNRAWRHDQ